MNTLNSVSKNSGAKQSLNEVRSADVACRGDLGFKRGGPALRIIPKLRSTFSLKSASLYDDLPRIDQRRFVPE